MNIGDIYKAIVVINEGSGVIIPSIDGTNNYILTAKHVIEDTKQSKKADENIDSQKYQILIRYFQDDENKRAEFPAIEGTNYYPHKELDIAIIKLGNDIEITKGINIVAEKDWRKADSDEVKKYLKGSPKTRRNENEQLNAWIRDDAIGSFVTNGNVVEGKLIQNQSLGELVGSSGGGIFGVISSSKHAFLYGIQNKMPGNKDENLSNIIFTPIEYFDKLIKDYNLSPFCDPDYKFFPFKIKNTHSIAGDDLRESLRKCKAVFQLEQYKNWDLVKESNKQIFRLSDNKYLKSTKASICEEIGKILYGFLKNSFEDEIEQILNEKNYKKIRLGFEFRGEYSNIPWEYLMFPGDDRAGNAKYLFAQFISIIRMNDVDKENLFAVTTREFSNANLEIHEASWNSNETKFDFNYRIFPEAKKDGSHPTVIHYKANKTMQEKIVSKKEGETGYKIDEILTQHIKKYSQNLKDNLVLVVLESVSDSIEDQYDIFDAVAMEFLKRQGNDFILPALISIPYTLGDKSVEVFNTFYENLSNGISLCDSYSKLTKQLIEDGISLPIIYMNSGNFKLTEKKPKSSTEEDTYPRRNPEKTRKEDETELRKPAERGK